MSFTNQTPNFGLPQWIGTDKPTFLGDLNGAFSDIDTALKNNADASTAATATANSASATATSANTNATTALSTANSAASDAASAVTTAQSADTKATQALSAASGAETAAAANTIENLAPAYDNTLTYDVGDLVTFVDSQGHGRLYKCVIAVNSPMDFNINYWDDVTTSEVYRKKPRILATVTAQSGETWKKVLERLWAGITEQAENLELIRVNPSGLHTKYIFTDYLTNTSLTFDKVSFDGTSVVLQEIHLQTNSCSLHIGTNNVYSDASSDLMVEGTILIISEL